MIQIHLSNFKIIILLNLSRTQWFEGQNIAELYAYFLEF